MPSENGSDRERLLRLIDGDPSAIKEIDSKQKARRSMNKIHLIFESLSHGIYNIFFRRLRSFKDLLLNLLKGKVSFRDLELTSINKLLVFALILLCGYLGTEIVRNTLLKTRAIMADLKTSASRYEGDKVSRLSSLESYLEMFGAKDIFNVDRITTVGGGLASLNGLKFVGVDWDDDPTAMIEDANEGRTYFVKTGDTLKNIKIKEIMKDRVVFSFEGGMYELK